VHILKQQNDGAQLLILLQGSCRWDGMNESVTDYGSSRHSFFGMWLIVEFQVLRNWFRWNHNAHCLAHPPC